MIIVKIYLEISLELLWAVWVSSVSDNPLFGLLLVLKVYRCPSNAQSPVLNAGFYSDTQVTSIAALFFFFFFLVGGHPLFASLFSV